MKKEFLKFITLQEIRCINCGEVLFCDDECYIDRDSGLDIYCEKCKIKKDKE